MTLAVPCSTRAITQQVLVVPISSEAMMPLRGAAGAFFIPSAPVLTGSGWHAQPRRRVRSELQDEPVRLAEIDDLHVAVDELVDAIDLGEAGDGARRILLRQLDVDAVVEMQVPAPAADAHRR